MNNQHTNATQSPSSFSINSKHYIDKIENDIVNLTKTISIEYQINIEEAKQMARTIVQRKLNGVLSEEQNNGINKLNETVKNKIKNKTDTEFVNLVYELLKTMELI